MSLNIALDEQTQEQLEQLAREEGMDSSEFVHHLVIRELLQRRHSEVSLWDKLTPEEWIAQTRAWVQSHSGSLPILPDEAISREGIYGEHP